jgi:L-threonylcarbamoyladenylate synthase
LALLQFFKRLTTASAGVSRTAAVLSIMETRIVRVPSKGQLGKFPQAGAGGAGSTSRLESWETDPSAKEALSELESAAAYLRSKDTPVAFPTETVYGLGADATRSASVKGIYAAKGRPSDNPLIVHVCDLQMLRGLLRGADQSHQGHIPSIYEPLIERFWPGPLTILLPNPKPSQLAPEVTAGLDSFGVRMPSSPFALSLIKLAGVPLAAPSANASTKPSPTTAQHVMDDLDGRIELILDGGSCHVGVESTVVDGLCDPPVVLRPGGVGLDELRSCPGWERTVKGYRDSSEVGKAAPRAPGMKYKHYSPKAKVVLYEASYARGSNRIDSDDIMAAANTVDNCGNAALRNGSHRRKVGVVRTQRWKEGAGLRCGEFQRIRGAMAAAAAATAEDETSYTVYESELLDEKDEAIGELLDIDLGRDVRGIAQGLFSALRELDRRGADIIFVDGIEDEIDIAGAVMNRLRKAASEIKA